MTTDIAGRTGPSGGRVRAALGLLAVTVLLPLAVLLLGLWEGERGRADLAELEGERLHLARTVAALEARLPRDGRTDFGVQFRWGGQTYAGPLALDKAREARDDVATTRSVAQVRRALPPVVVGAAGLAAGLSLVILLAGLALGRVGRRSRDALVRGFSLVRRVLPSALGVQVVLATAAFVAAVTFEAAALLHSGVVSGGEIKLLMIAAVVVLGSLWVAGSTVWQLRRTLAAFEPDPLPILGRVVAPDEAPGLWRLLDALAERLGALRPDNVVVGLTEGFFVSSGAKVLEPAGQALAGRTLYLPLPTLPWLRPDEVIAIIGHELAHFSGGDTAYSLRFLPIYAGVGRSLDAVARGGAGGRGAGSPLLRPALRLGVFVMDQFHHAVRHWSRQREFAADAAGAALASPEAAARALLRTAALQPRIVEALDAAAEAPDAAPSDLVAGILAHAAAQGLDDPTAHLEEAQPHPTDTHPPTRQRLDALGHPPTPALVAATAAVAPPEAMTGLTAYFADPAALCRAATDDFLAVVRRNQAAYRAHLEASVSEIGSAARELREGTRNLAVFLAGAGSVFLLAMLALALLGLPGLSDGEARLVAALVSPVALMFLAYGVFLLRRGERPFLVLRAEALSLPGLDRPIAWDDIADLDLRQVNARITLRALLMPAAPFPQRVRGGCRVRLDAKRRIVKTSALMPRGMTVRVLADLIGRHRYAARARRILAEEAAASPPLVAKQTH